MTSERIDLVDIGDLGTRYFQVSVSKALGDLSLASCMTELLAVMFKELHMIYDRTNPSDGASFSKWEQATFDIISIF